MDDLVYFIDLMAGRLSYRRDLAIELSGAISGQTYYRLLSAKPARNDVVPLVSRCLSQWAASLIIRILIMGFNIGFRGQVG